MLQEDVLQNSLFFEQMTDRGQKHTISFLERVPDALYFIIRGFLSASDYLSMLHTSKVFSLLKKFTVYYKMNCLHSNLYLQCPSFRQRVKKNIVYPSLQLHLQLLEFSPLVNCPLDSLPHQVTLGLIIAENLSSATFTRSNGELHNKRYWDTFSFSELVQTIDPASRIIFNGQTINISDAGTTHLKGSTKYDSLLKSSGFGYDLEAFSLSYNTVVQDCFSFQNLSKLILQNCDSVKNVASLGRLHHLELIDCENIRDVSGLSSVYRLVLSGCEGILDISTLKENHYLSIENCPNIGIASFSSLTQQKHLRSLKLQHPRPIRLLKLPTSLRSLALCNAIEGEIQLGGPLREMSFFTCPIGSYLSNSWLQELSCLHLHQCYQLNGLSGLESIRTLIIDQCHDLFSLSGLRSIKSGGSNYRVEISNCSSIMDFSGLLGMPVVKIRSCKRFKRLEDVRGAEKLTVEESFNFKAVKVWPEVKELTFSHCYRLSSIVMESNPVVTAVCERILSIIDCDDFDPSDNFEELKKWGKVVVSATGHFVEESLSKYKEGLQYSHGSERRGNSEIFLKRL